MDHAPVPRRHGGDETVPACRRCHDLKDRFPFSAWSDSELWAALAGFAPSADAAAAILARCNPSDGQQMNVTAADGPAVMEVAMDCSTPEARLALLKAYALGLDVTDFQRREAA